MTFGSLFSGIGGMDLGLERSGMTCKWQVEIDQWCRERLAGKWLGVKRHDDVNTFPPNGTPRDWYVDVIAGGFPCQDVSLAGKGEGIDGSRSGLWKRFRDIIRDLQPRYVLVENTPGLIVRGLDRVLGDLACLGFDAEWDVLSAAAFGASQLRKRLFIVAYPSGQRLPADLLAPSEEFRRRDAPQGWRRNVQFERLGGRVGDQEYPPTPGDGEWSRIPQSRWEPPCVQRGVRGAVHGTADGMDRIHAIGNMVFPANAEWIGRRILEASGGGSSA